MSDQQRDVNEWLDSDQGQWTTTAVIVLIVVGFVGYILLTSSGWVFWLTLALSVLAVVALVYFMFFARKE